LGVALLLGGCASNEPKAAVAPAPAPTAQDAAAQKAAEQQAAREARANAAREIAKAQQAQREQVAQLAAQRAQAEADAKANEQAAAEAAKAADEAQQAAADKAAADKAAADAAAKAAADKAAADKAAAAAAAAGTAAAAASKDTPVNPYDLNVVAELETTAGTMVLGFYPDVAPGHVKNFVDLARKGFYDGTLFHRVIKGFMIQGGDPNTKDLSKAALWGQGGPGYTIKAEFSKKPHMRGTLSMARKGNDVNSAGSQFFICHAPAPNLDNQYSVFGELLTGYDVLDKIAAAPVTGDRPQDPVKILKVTVRPRTPDDKKQGG
jgi:cyclophilin family peptidyl-prolyl cis-trans isomerase